MASYEHHEIKALVNILVKKGIITEEEWHNEVKAVRKHERDVMFGRIKNEEK